MQTVRHGNRSITFYSDPVDVPSLVSAISAAPVESGLGRGGVRVFNLEGHAFVSREYLHGGLFRAVTGNRFASDERLSKEAAVLNFLRGQGFPAVEPFCGIVENRGASKGLSLVTRYEDGVDFLEYLRVAGSRHRLRAARALATLLWELHRLGVFHPDLHLRNVLVRPNGTLVFLDFDRAERRPPTRADAEHMLWRLDRYGEKMERLGNLAVHPRERTLFVRTFDRLSGYGLEADMQSMEKSRKRRRRLGWYIESALYRGR